VNRDAPYTPFGVAECPRCGDVVLAGRAEGLTWRVDPRTVPRAHAWVLKAYGVTPLKLRRAPGGRMHAVAWHPPGQLGDLVVVPHVCGSAHAVSCTTTPRAS
jgi:hypothetical protein